MSEDEVMVTHYVPPSDAPQLRDAIKVLSGGQLLTDLEITALDTYDNGLVLGFPISHVGWQQVLASVDGDEDRARRSFGVPVVEMIHEQANLVRAGATPTPRTGN